MKRNLGGYIKTVIFGVVLLLTGQASVAPAGSFLTQAKWLGCQGDLCYTLKAHRAGMSVFMKSVVFADGVELSIVHRQKPRHPISVTTAREAFWYPQQSRWVLFNGEQRHSSKVHDYVFDEKTMALSHLN